MLFYPDDPAAEPTHEQGIRDGEAGYGPRLFNGKGPKFFFDDPATMTRDQYTAYNWSALCTAFLRPYYEGWRIGRDRWKAAGRPVAPDAPVDGA